MTYLTLSDFNSSSSFECLWVPPLGKPSKEANHETLEYSSRIPQPGQKGNTCWYYAPIAAGKKIQEKAVSALRKECTQLTTETIPLQIDAVQVAVKLLRDLGINGPLTKQIYSKYKLSFKLAIIDEVSKKYLYTYDGNDLFRDFMSQNFTDDLEQYPQQLPEIFAEKGLRIFERYVKNNNIFYDLNVEVRENSRSALKAVSYSTLSSITNQTEDMIISSTEDIMEDEKIQNSLKNMLKRELSFKTKFAYIHSFVIRDCYRKSGFEESSWAPCCSFEALAESLEIHGPHIVKGYFGVPAYYKVPPSHDEDQKDLIGRKIYYWKKDDPHIETTIDT